jgi:4-hydroxymandelate oxidase
MSVPESKSDQSSSLPLNLEAYEAAAREALSQMFYDYIAGGAADEITLRSNRTAFERIALKPRVLVDVSQINMTSELLGTTLEMPVLVAIMATHRLCHEDGEKATARAAHNMGIIPMIGTLSNYTIDEVRAVSDGPMWFQLYAYKDMGINRAIIEQGVAGGAEALVVTVDTPYIGRRERDLRNQLTIPPELVTGHLRNLPLPATQEPAKGAANIFRSYDLRSQSMTWKDLATFRDMARGMPLVLKGILTPEDAKLAVEYGVDAIIVSNHGGRQLDTAIPSIDALPDVVDAVAGRIPVLLDGGIRRGTDVIKALAFGARAVLIGRPALWGLAVNGEAGVQHVLELLRGEIELAMALCGKTSLDDLDRSLLKLYR